MTAKVTLKNHNSSEVMVLLKRERKIKESEDNAAAETRLWFYTVYEPGRGK
ncbi:TPA: hypothetical protein PXL76_002134 [Yersinia enterocolitica]|nr:hypothetical protein [Yersinia enterocolitica]HDL6890663.1 hypothetical protein [Yersinia enterocolitica]